MGPKKQLREEEMMQNAPEFVLPLLIFIRQEHLKKIK